MGHKAYIALSLGILACGVWIHSRVDKPRPKPSNDAPITSAQSTALKDLSPQPGSVANRDAGSGLTERALAEGTLMQRVRSNLTRNPALAEELAREGRQRFPASPYADERDMLLAASLYNQHRLGRATVEADYYLEHHPDGLYRKDMAILSSNAASDR